MKKNRLYALAAIAIALVGIAACSASVKETSDSDTAGVVINDSTEITVSESDRDTASRSDSIEVVTLP